jgi:hypothetical protein
MFGTMPRLKIAFRLRRQIVDAIKAHDRASEIDADGVSDPRHHR